MEGTIRKKGKSWYYRFDVAKQNGKRTQYERFGGHTRQEAREALRKALKIYRATGTIPESEKLSVTDYFNYWFKHYVERNLAENTRENYRTVIDKYVIPQLGIYPVSKIRPATLQSFIDHVASSTEYKADKTRLSAHTVEIIWTVVQEAFKYAVHPLELIQQSPAIYVEPPRRKKKPASRESLKIITQGQFQQIVYFLGPHSDIVVPFLISFYTGMRRGEVCGLEWSDIDLTGGEIKVQHQLKQYSAHDLVLGKLKTASSYRTIPISNNLTAILRQQRNRQSENRLRYGQRYHESNFVCTKENGYVITPYSIKYYSDKIQHELGFPFNFHSLRHTHATMLLEGGASPKEVQVRLGHSRISTTMDTYIHLTDKKKRQTADLFDKLSHISL